MFLEPQLDVTGNICSSDFGGTVVSWRTIPCNIHSEGQQVRNLLDRDANTIMDHYSVWGFCAVEASI